MSQTKESPTKYRIELTERQLRYIKNALEFRFRIFLGQGFDLCNDCAFYGLEDTDYNTPEGKEIFNYAIQRRDHLVDVIRAFFHIAFGVYGVPKEKSKETLILTDMWDQMRVALGQSRWGEHFLHEGEEPVMKIEKVEKARDVGNI